MCDLEEKNSFYSMVLMSAPALDLFFFSLQETQQEYNDEKHLIIAFLSLVQMDHNTRVRR